MITALSTALTKRITLFTLPITALIAALALFAMPALAAPKAQQNTLPDFTLNSQTIISVTVAITGGQVIVVPVDLTFIAENADGETDVSIVADVEQQAGIFIGVAPSRITTATLELPQTAAQRAAAENAAEETEAQPTNQTGTHVANRNSNLRSGPGTNFAIVGRVPAGGSVVITGENGDGTWLQTEDGSWIAEFLVDPVQNNIQDEDETDEDALVQSEEAVVEEAAPEATIEEEATSDLAVNAETALTLATYVQTIATIGGEAAGAVDTLNALMSNPQPASVAWRSDIASQLAALSGSLDEYLALTPVPGYEDLHTQVTNVALTCETAVDYLVGGLQNPLAIDPTVATENVDNCASQANALANNVESLQS